MASPFRNDPFLIKPSAVPRPDPHPILNRQAAEALRLLADPELDDGVPLPNLDDGQAAILVRAAAVHGIISTAYRHLKSGPDAGALTAALARAEPLVLSAITGSMRLRRWAEHVTRAFDAAGLRHALIKGPVFAERLYAHPSDRIYTDIDIVLRDDALLGAAAALTELGFKSNDIPNRDAAAHCEFKWTLHSDTAVTVELLTNLIHSPRVRRSVFVDLDAISEAGGGDPKDATSLLYVAGVHAASGHQFDRLSLLVDVLQAVRGRAGPIDPERLRNICLRSGALRAVAAAIALAGRMYGDPRCMALAKHLMPGVPPLEWSAVSPSIVLKAQSAAGARLSWRRRVFRQLVARPVRQAGR